MYKKRSLEISETPVLIYRTHGAYMLMGHSGSQWSQLPSSIYTSNRHTLW